MTHKLHRHIRSNVVGYVAIFLFAMSGTAAALTGSNTVFSDDLVNGEVKTQDIGKNQVRSVDVANDSTGFALTGADVADNTIHSPDISNNSLTGADVADNTIHSPDISQNSLTGDDVNESTLGQVPSALLGGLGRTGAETNCDPESETFITCAATPVLNVPPGARALILARVQATSEVGADSGGGDCRLGSSSTGVAANTTNRFFPVDDTNFVEQATLIGVTPPLPAGNTSFGIDCNQDESFGAIQYFDVSASVLLISAS